MAEENEAIAVAIEARPMSRARRVVTFPLVLMVIAILFFAAASALATVGISILNNHDDRSPELFLNAPIVILCVLAGYWLFCRYVERAPMALFDRSGWARELLAGSAAGAFLFSVAVAAVALLGFYRMSGWGHGWAIWAPLTSALIAGFTEELLFRGILFRYIERTAGSWVALGLTSALFGAAHLGNPNASWFSAFAIAVEAGILLGAIYMLTRRLWAAMGLHAAWNFTQGWIFGLPVSGSAGGDGMVHGQLVGPELLTGGAFGLEASVPALVVATSAGLAILAVAVRRGRVVAPMWRRSETPAFA